MKIAAVFNIVLFKPDFKTFVCKRCILSFLWLKAVFEPETNLAGLYSQSYILIGEGSSGINLPARNFFSEDLIRIDNKRT